MGGEGKEGMRRGGGEEIGARNRNEKREGEETRGGRRGIREGGNGKREGGGEGRKK